MSNERQIPWKELVEAVLRRYKLVALMVFLGAGVAAVKEWMEPPIYRATARIQLTAKDLSGPRAEAMSDRQIQAELALLRSPELIRSVLESPQDGSGQGTVPPEPSRSLVASTKRWLADVYRTAHGAPPLDPIDQLVRRIGARVEILPIGRSNVVEIGFSDGDPTRAASFVNSLLRMHVKRIASLGELAEVGQLGVLGGLTEQSARRFSEARQELDAFLAQQGPSVLEKDEEQLREVLGRLETERVAAETQLLEYQAQVSFLAEQLEIYPETVSTESRVMETESEKFLESRLLELELERSELLGRYTENSTLVRQIDAQIEATRGYLGRLDEELLSETLTEPSEVHQALDVDRLKTMAQMNAARARIQALDLQISDYRTKLSQLNEAAGELERLKNEVESAREAHQAYLRQAEEARSDISTVASGNVNITLIDRAEPPVSPIASGGGMRILAGSLAGLLLGILVALVTDWLNPSVKSSTQVVRLTEAPIIAEVPR